MEAQKTDTKPKRASNLQYEAGFTVTIRMHRLPQCKLLEKEKVIALLLGIGILHPWFPPNESTRIDYDPFEIISTESRECGGWSLRCAQARSILREKHIDAYLCYVHTVGQQLYRHLQDSGVKEVEVGLQLWSHIRTFAEKPYPATTKAETTVHNGEVC